MFSARVEKQKKASLSLNEAPEKRNDLKAIKRSHLILSPDGDSLYDHDSAFRSALPILLASH